MLQIPVQPVVLIGESPARPRFVPPLAGSFIELLLGTLATYELVSLRAIACWCPALTAVVYGLSIFQSPLGVPKESAELAAVPATPSIRGGNRGESP